MMDAAEGGEVGGGVGGRKGGRSRWICGEGVVGGVLVLGVVFGRGGSLWRIVGAVVGVL